MPTGGSCIRTAGPTPRRSEVRVVAIHGIELPDCGRSPAPAWVELAFALLPPLYWDYPPAISTRATITSGVTMTARTDDHVAIVRVMRLYIDGFNDNDVSKFRQAFDEHAWIFYIDADGALHKHRISEDFERWAAPPVGALWVDSFP